MLQGKIASDVISKRQQYLHSMKKFLEEQKLKLQEALDKLGLDHQLQQVEPKQTCPYNEDHIIPEVAFDKHVEKCRLLSAGCQKDELDAQLQDLDFVYKDVDSILKVEMDEKVLNKVIWDSCVKNGQVYTGHRRMPVSDADSHIHLTPDDRLALYRYVVQRSHEAGKVLPVDRDDLLTTDWGSLVKKGLLDEQNNKEYGSKLEQLAALRDMKRRRQSYRAKNTHITKKSYTEIIREVIVNQMEILTPSSQHDYGDDGKTSDVTESITDPKREEKTNNSSSYRQRRSPRRERGRGRSHDRHSRGSGSRHNSFSREDGNDRSSHRDKRRDRSLSRQDGNGRSSHRSRRHDRSEVTIKTEKMEEEGSVVWYGRNEQDRGQGRDEQDIGQGRDGQNKGQDEEQDNKTRKRSRSPSHSGSDDDRSRRSKKSKHKKKHSKKHKR